MSDNTTTIIGNLVEDPELRFTPGGTPLARIRIAVNKRRKEGNEWVDDGAHFFGGTVWREQAENAAESLTKGTRVIVTGRLEQRSWETTEGDKRSVVEIAIDEIGPSLRWSTANVTRTPKGDSGSRPAPTQDYGPDEAPF